MNAKSRLVRLEPLSLLFTILATMLVSLNVKASGIQVCVDSKGSAYTAVVAGFANAGTTWSGVLSSESPSAIASGSDLATFTFKGELADSAEPSIVDMSFKLKRLVAPSVESLQEGAEISYLDEPRIYEASGVDLVCSSTMSDDEYASLAK